jgi:hypothetical protein
MPIFTRTPGPIASQLHQPVPLVWVQPNELPPDPRPQDFVLRPEELDLADELVLGAAGEQE